MYWRVALLVLLTTSVLQAKAEPPDEQALHLLNWLGCIIDAVVVLSVVAVVVADNTYTPEHRAYAIGLAVVLGAIPLGIDRALRYILAGT